MNKPDIKADINDVKRTLGPEAAKKQLAEGVRKGRQRNAKHSADTGAGQAGKPSARPENGKVHKVDENGFHYWDPKRERMVWAGNIIERTMLLCDESGKGYSVLYTFVDLNGKTKTCIVPLTQFATDGASGVVRLLLDKGYNLRNAGHHRDAKSQLMQFITDDLANLPKGISATKAGYINNRQAFALGGKEALVINRSDTSVVCDMESGSFPKLSMAGDKDDWKNHVSKNLVNNPLPIFAVSSALCGPLLRIAGESPFSINFYGPSSKGKTTLLKLALSTLGLYVDMLHSWDATSVGFQALLKTFCDLFLCIDELGSADPKSFQTMVYTIGNPVGRARGKVDASLQEGERYSTVVLSTSEKPSSDFMPEGEYRAGHAVRMIDIPVDTGPHGAFHDLHGHEDAADFSNHLLTNCARYYGTAMPAFIEMLLNMPEHELVSTVDQMRSNIRSQLIDRDVSGQVRRTADKFALVAVAGELATVSGLTGWEYGNATLAAKHCLDLWLNHRGGTGDFEDRQALDHVRTMLTRYGEINFSRWDREDPSIDEHSPRTGNRWGFRKTIEEKDCAFGNTTENHFYMTRDGFRDMCDGHDTKRVARLLYEKGALETDREAGRLTKKVRLPGAGKKPVNCYVINYAALVADDDHEIEDQDRS